jgi:hypothetical protein
MLEHLTPGYRNEALAGDLREEFLRRRSAVWYWRQALTAVVIAWSKDVVDHGPLIAFAALWTVLAPGWWLLTLKMEEHQNFFGLWGIAWPWSTILAIGLSVVLNLTFIWMGAIFFVAACASFAKNFRFTRIRRGLLLSVLAYIGASCCLMALSVAFPFHGHVVDWRRLTLFGEITNLNLQSLVSRMPCILALLCALWGATAPVESNRKKIIA